MVRSAFDIECLIECGKNEGDDNGGNDDGVGGGGGDGDGDGDGGGVNSGCAGSVDLCDLRLCDF